MEKYGDDVDPETIVSMYIPHRRPKRIGAALLRMSRGYPDYYRAGQTWQEQAGDFKAATFFRRKRGSGNGIGTSYHVV